MKFGTINHENKPTLVTLTGAGVVPLAELYASADLGEAPASLNALIEGGEEELERARTALAKGSAAALDEASIDWLPAQPRPTKVLGVAFNNMGIRKAAHRDPGVPNFFLKAPSCLTGHNKPVIIEEHYGETIPELELAAVIGRRARKISVEEARSAIFGYTIVNDVTSHGLKFGLDSIATTREPDLIRPHHLGWRNRHGDDDRDVYFVYHTRSKASDTFGPMGPWLTTADEVADPNNLTVKGWLDGEPFAVDSTASYRFKVEEVVAEASAYFTLEPGDVICFGTSAKGVGKFPNGHRSVNMHKLTGVMDVEIDGLGRLSNPIVHDWVR
ncbi:fumarylacetoacetate hydrolase family protein [Chelatococcus asaccharovorans]|uniref:2-keto-4-pentenoate hydratase/2-oxohepta-3-ene-1,7-dioic acid hydratase in catechol pathway n=1 Tax=Chelatococcus asaccharovorans TaxID=28210 RepID=A0A2V3TVL8_9HYPH|nr:fumarylacetoacetate hydrolase family protein [Chelatococcus asaccharovorans]MBS7705028.1 fumarylacetoacetate hydrolase family protein [Chelatococcus asaccharovorans]PXW53518.1 2-keto-4-pentenoate hydratase/2-oxohepta-3-ene-1,7-dioic acid hydratase in catechol pathway [Chelatococcus asaccharovorans]